MICRYRILSLAEATLTVLVASSCVVALSCVGSPAAAQPAPSAEVARVDRLAQNVERAESVRLPPN